MSLFWSFSIAGGFLPLILRARGVDTSLSVSETYRSYVWICELTCIRWRLADATDLPGVTATLLAGAVRATG